ncbi:MAG: hypothetical protein O3B01_25720 [Planctomycetota bacterium]|nr:hypothetical protein [Planctomycetota bacterium]
MPTEQLLSELRRRYIYKQVNVTNIDALFAPRHILFATPNSNHIGQFYHFLHSDYLKEPRTQVLLTASNKDEALERAKRVKPCVMLIDKYLPDKGGYDFYYKLEEFYREEMPPALILMPPGDNGELQRPNFGLIYLYRGVFKPIPVLQGLAAILVRMGESSPTEAYKPEETVVATAIVG